MEIRVVEKPKFGKAEKGGSKYQSILEQLKDLEAGKAIAVTPDCQAMSAKYAIYRVARAMGLKVHVREVDGAVNVWM